MKLQTKSWNQLIKRLTHPETSISERPEEWGPLPSWQARHANTTNEDESDNSDDEDEHDNNQDNAESREPLPPRQPPPRNQPPPPSQPAERIYDPKLWRNNPKMCEMVGHSLGASLQILDLGLGASEIEAKVKYRQLARIYHPDKNNQAAIGLTTEEASEFFKLLNNVNEYLKERMWQNLEFEFYIWNWKLESEIGDFEIDLNYLFFYLLLLH